MKLAVVRCDGQQEILNLTGEWTVVEGQYLNRLTKDGFDHFFTHDGLYDGWGGAVNTDEANAAAVIEAIEQKREIK